MHCTKLLLSHGADVRVQLGLARSTPLHLAAEEGSVECTKLLLSAGAAWEAKNARGQTAMHLAALAQSVETLDVLINAGAKVNADDDDGRTPLHAAVAKALRSGELVKILIQVRSSIEDLPNNRHDINFFASKGRCLGQQGGQVRLHATAHRGSERELAHGDNAAGEGRRCDSAHQRRRYCS